LRRQTADWTGATGPNHKPDFSCDHFIRAGRSGKPQRKAAKEKQQKEKLQAPSSNIQRNSKLQSFTDADDSLVLRLEDSLELGAWNLVLSIGSLDNRDTGNHDGAEIFDRL